MGWVIAAQFLVSAGFSAYVADVKNRNAATWGILGLVFGIFALIAIAGLPVAEPTTERAREEATATGAKPWNPLAGPPN
jgi:hypothetical protein